MNPAEYGLMFRAEDHHWWYRGLRAMLRQALNASPLPLHAAVLDLGCGTGANSVMLARRARVVSMDLNTTALGHCRERGLTRLVQASAQSLPFARHTFDAVILTDVLYHRAIPEKEDVLGEVARVMKPGAIALINVPAHEWLRSPHDDHIHTDKRFTRGELRRLLESAAFEVPCLTHWNTLLLPAIAILRYWNRVRGITGSDLKGHAGGVTAMIGTAALAVERMVMRIIPLPFGVSIFAVARKR